MFEWTRNLPTTSGIFDHRNLENAGGRAPIPERVVWVGYVNWPQDPTLGHGTVPMPLGSGKLRACRIEHPMTTDSLTVQDWGGEWRSLGGALSCEDRDSAALSREGVQTDAKGATTGQALSSEAAKPLASCGPDGKEIS